MNISDPRVRRRAQRALNYVFANTNPNSPRMLSTRDIDMYFGQQQHDLSKSLRKLLLIEKNSFYNWQSGKMKQYLRNKQGCKYLQHLLDPTIPYEVAEEQGREQHVSTFKQELETGKFTYKDKSNRQWHPLQNMPSAERKREFSKYNYCHIYDIRCAAPSIILHIAKDAGTKPKHTAAIEHYIANRTEIRQRISNDLNISISDAKKLLTMLFNGAPLGLGKQFPDGGWKYLATGEILQYDRKRIDAAKAHPDITELRSSISKCWQKITNYQTDGEYLMPREYRADGKKKRINGKDRWALYYRYERHVMNSVTAYLDKQGAMYFIEHDGWSSTIQIDSNELTHHVRSVTGIDTIEFDYEYYCKPSSAYALAGQTQSSYTSLSLSDDLFHCLVANKTN